MKAILRFADGSREEHEIGEHIVTRINVEPRVMLNPNGPNSTFFSARQIRVFVLQSVSPLIYVEET